jgi:hypothetical protein
MAMRELSALAVGMRSIVPDGVSNSLTVDFSEDVRSYFNANKAPVGLHPDGTFAAAVDANSDPIASTVSRQGKKVTWAFASVPPALNINNAPNVFGVGAVFLFDSE